MFDCAGACGHYAADPYHATGSFVFVIRTSAPTPICLVAVARCLFCDGIVDQNLRRLKRCAYYTFIGATLLVLTVVAVMFARRDHKR